MGLHGIKLVLLLLISSLLYSSVVYSQAWDDPTPRALFYGDFETTGTPITIGASGLTLTAVRLETGKFGNGLILAKSVRLGSTISGSGHYLDPLKGTLSLWIKWNTFSHSGPVELTEIFPGPPALKFAWQSNVLPRQLVLTLSGQVLKSNDLTLVTGQWYHVAWSWWGMHHKFYLDGVLVKEADLGSPMVSEQTPTFRIGIFQGGSQDITIDEYTIYNAVLTQAQVTTLATAVAPGPLTLTTVDPLTSTQWAPGEKKAHIAVNVGNTHYDDATSITASVKNMAGSTIASTTTTALRRGFGEVVLQLPSMTGAIETPAALKLKSSATGSIKQSSASATPHGKMLTGVLGGYKSEVVLKDVSNATLATIEGPVYTLPTTTWLGANTGVSSVIQEPWTAITKDGDELGVIGRTMDFAGGYGFPQQIVSQGKSMLAYPPKLEIDVGGSLRTITSPAIVWGTVGTGEVTWTGTASAGDIGIGITGRLEYDGMMQFTMTLTPSTPTTINSIKLQIALPSDRAIYMATSTDQGYWWYPYKANTATAPGTFHTNLLQETLNSTFLPSIVFSDYDVALEWFADHPGGWLINEAVAIQNMIRDVNTDVRLELLLANKVITLSTPMTVTFGLIATPTKPLPADWRTAYVHFATHPMTSDLKEWWVWPADGESTGRSCDFCLYPEDIDLWKSSVASKRAQGIKIAPFTNAHVLVPVVPDSWESLSPIWFEETRNDGWISRPTAAHIDYWTYQLNRWLADDGIDAVYIDETYGFLTTNYLLAGGYIKENGTHGHGYNLSGIREQLKRTRQLFINHSKRPVVWVHTTARMWPHVWSFADMASEGEGFQYHSPSDPDWVDTWGKRLLEVWTDSPGLDSTGGPWIQSIGRGQKFGLIPTYLNYIAFSGNLPAWTTAARAMQGLLGLLDIIPVEYRPLTLPTVKQAWGMGNAGVTFHGYWEQTAVSTDRADVKVSYYQQTGTIMAYVMNLGEAYTGEVTIDFSGLGFTAGFDLEDAETHAVLTPSGNDVTVTIPRHDYKIIIVNQ